MSEKWKVEKKNDNEIRELWNEYVPEHLLPRLYGFELMMAPYSIAHMKIGLKLRETGYTFISSERAQIYLTNTLEEPKDFSDYFVTMAPALAHEADAANRVKRRTPITVVIGNPPYSGISNNMNPWIDGLLKGKLPDGTNVGSYYELDGKPLGEKKLWLQDDYVKFIRYGQYKIDLSGTGVLGYISNHSYLDNPTFRGMRQQLLHSFQKTSIIDLHGNSVKKEKAPDGSIDLNVFDIEQGVSIGLFSKRSSPQETTRSDIWGPRDEKYKQLLASSVTSITFQTILPNSPYYFFTVRDEAVRPEYELGWKLTDIFLGNVTGIVTARDGFVTDINSEVLLNRIEDFRNSEESDDVIRSKYFGEKGSEKYKPGDSRGWKLPEARLKVQNDIQWRERIKKVIYRPFDERFVYYTTWMVDWPRPEGMGHMLSGRNLAITIGRAGQVIDQGSWNIIYCTREISEFNLFRRGGNNLFPLYLYPSEKDKQFGVVSRYPNLSDKFLKEFSLKLGLEFVHDEGDDSPSNWPRAFTPEDVFAYAYAIFHSPTYRARYSEFLKIDFPRLPLTTDLELFRKLCTLGSELVALHLLEGVEVPRDWNLKTDGSTLYDIAEVAAGFPKYQEGKVFINKTAWLDGVEEEVWNFHIGGYQVCHKWLKDRKGRTLSAEDIAHYGKITVALRETIRLMAEIDQVIEAHGGFPLPGSVQTKI